MSDMDEGQKIYPDLVWIMIVGQWGEVRGLPDQVYGTMIVPVVDTAQI